MMNEKLMATDERFMRMALVAALNGRFSTSPNPRVGCVLVRDGQVISTGWHMRRGGPHAELAAIIQARQQGIDLAGSTCYVTLEPCSHFGSTPPCANALVDAGVVRVVAASEDPNPLVSGLGFRRLRDAGIEVKTDVLNVEASALNPGFFSRMQRKRPFVRVKIAASLDGRTALSNGASQWITQAAAREDVHRLRALSSAILTGAGTVLADDPMLTVRSTFVLQASEGLTRQPLRVVLAGQQAIPADSRIFQPSETAALLVYANSQSATAPAGVQTLSLPSESDSGRVDLKALLERLASDYLCNELLVEAGPTLASRFLAEGLCDELWWYSGAVLLGADAKAAIDPLGYQTMDSVKPFRLQDLVRFDNDTRTILSQESNQPSAAAGIKLQMALYHWTTED